jgi:hypothetical protein
MPFIDDANDLMRGGGEDVPGWVGRSPAGPDPTRRPPDARSVPDGPLELTTEQQHCFVQQHDAGYQRDLFHDGSELERPVYASFSSRQGPANPRRPSIGETTFKPTTLALSLDDNPRLERGVPDPTSTSGRQPGLASTATFSQLELRPGDGTTATFEDSLRHLPAEERTSFLQDGTIRWRPDNLEAAVGQLAALKRRMRHDTALDQSRVRTYWLSLNGVESASRESLPGAASPATHGATASQNPTSIVVLEEDPSVDLRPPSERDAEGTPRFDNLTLGYRAALLRQAASTMPESTIIYCLPDRVGVVYDGYNVQHNITAADLEKFTSELSAAGVGPSSVIVTTDSRLYPQLSEYLYDTEMSPMRFAELTSERNRSYLPDPDSPVLGSPVSEDSVLDGFISDSGSDSAGSTGRRGGMRGGRGGWGGRGGRGRGRGVY